MAELMQTTSHTLRAALAERIRNQDVQGSCGYVYGYPHKKAYRPLSAPLDLQTVWAGEDTQRLYAYVHIPFCNQRCSFCNLFTYVPGDSPAHGYVEALAREMDSCARALGRFRFTRLYIGGGTPTYLSTAELRQLVADLRGRLAIDPAATHGCIETSPETLDSEKVATLRELGFVRISLGIQSLVDEELRQVNRRFDFDRHVQAVRLIGQAGFPHFNIDLIYGLPGQTRASWRYSLDWVRDSPATSLFLYPLYIRPLTGLAVRRRSLDTLLAPSRSEMAAMYDLAVERLALAGFRQLTMRQFRRDPMESSAETYRCQRDGMLGLGAGARSYTTRLHYSTPWRMRAHNIRAVVTDYIARMGHGDTRVVHGFLLDENEQQRRWVILSLLFEGLDLDSFARTFATDARAVFPQEFAALTAEGLLIEKDGLLRLTALGMRHADVVGQLFFSARVRRLMEAYEYDT